MSQELTYILSIIPATLQVMYPCSHFTDKETEDLRPSNLPKATQLESSSQDFNCELQVLCGGFC